MVTDKKNAPKNIAKAKRKELTDSANRRKSEVESDAAKRKQWFLDNFKAEAAFIREEILRDLPALHLMLNLHAESFDDIALRVIAKQRGEIFDPEHPPIPDCPYCKQHDMVGTKGDKRYRCRRCQRDFSATHNSLISDAKVSDTKFLQVVMAILEGYSQTKTCAMANISPTTYFRIRAKLFYALRLMLEPVRLFGIVEADCSFVRISYKGFSLSGENDFDEFSPFYDENAFIPREARQRGGPYSKLEWGANTIAILSLRDEYGNCANIFCGTGLLNKTSLKMYVPENKVLPTVPESNPFPYIKEEKKNKKDKKTRERAPGDATLLVIDKEAALESYARMIGIDYESHVYRDKGVQRKLPEGTHNIQHINAMHSRLKKYLGNINSSSKFLPGFLLLFDFREMTGMSPEAIGVLLEILATPGLGKSEEYLKNQHQVPNYLQQIFSGSHPLRHVPYNRLLGFYLYDHIRNKQDYPDTKVTMDYIEQVTGYSDKKIRTNYRNLLNANANSRALIREYFGETLKAKKGTVKQPKTVPPVIPLLHKEWGSYVRGEKGLRPSFSAFVRMKQEARETTMSRNRIAYWFDQAEALGICEPLPPKESWAPVAPNIPPIALRLYDEWLDLHEKEPDKKHSLMQFHMEKEKQHNLDFSYATLRTHFQHIETLHLRPTPGLTVTISSSVPTTRNMALYEDYERLCKEQKTLGSKGMRDSSIRKILAEEYGLESSGVKEIIREVRMYRSNHSRDDTAGGYTHVLRDMEQRSQRQKTDTGLMTLRQFSPVAAGRWHPTKNGELTPDTVSYGSAKQVWWLCPECGYEWKAEVRRQAQKLKCPICYRKTRKGSAEALVNNPSLMSLWHSEKNSTLNPEHITLGSTEKAWWRCEKGHEWEKVIREQATAAGCPFCQNKRVLAGMNDLASQYPEIAAQWHPTKNGDLKPEQIIFGSTKRAWWLCEKGHEWEAIIRNRTLKKSGCPYCAGRSPKTTKEEGTLVAKSPLVAAQWHPSKNGSLTPNEVAAHSNKAVWWLCEKGHEWGATISSRSNGAGCPYCSNRKVLTGYNDLATLSPKIAAQWHPTKNGTLTPDQVLPKSGKKVWWLCDKGHVWETSIHNRSRGSSCPYCAHKSATPKLKSPDNQEKED